MRRATSTSRGLRGQSAFEFMFIFGIFLGAVLIGAWVSQMKTAEILKAQKDLEIDDLMTSVTDKINTAWLEGEGFSTNLTMPSRVAGTAYSVNVSANHVTLFIGDDYYIRPLVTANVSGGLVTGAVNRLENTGGAVVIS